MEKQDSIICKDIEHKIVIALFTIGSFVLKHNGKELKAEN